MIETNKKKCALCGNMDPNCKHPTDEDFQIYYATHDPYMQELYKQADEYMRWQVEETYRREDSL